MIGTELVFDVSRETRERLEVFVSLVRKWSPRINLVAPRDLEHLWQRHVRDSSQVFFTAPKRTSWLDMGSGGGFPGMVVAILARERNPDCTFTFVESDQRKSVFLRTAARETDCPVTVIAKRIEEVPENTAELLSARALAPLDQLLNYHWRHSHPDGIGLYQKGVNWKKEVTAARKVWQFDCEAIDSQTQPGAAILKIEGVARV